MKQTSLIIGIITIIGMVIGLIPCLGWFNWLNIPLAIVGIILGAIGYNEERQTIHQQRLNGMSTRQNSLPLGLILCSIACSLGLLRLVIGGGII